MNDTFNLENTVSRSVTVAGLEIKVEWMLLSKHCLSLHGVIGEEKNEDLL